jgi:hypothetical protein
MKNILTIAFIFFCTNLFAQNDLKISSYGIGVIHLGLKLDSLEKITGTKAKLKNIKLKDPDSYGMDTIVIKYKGLPFTIFLSKVYISENKSGVEVYGIASQNAGIKTLSGVGIGDDKFKIINTYDKYFMQIYPYYTDKKKVFVTVSPDNSTGVLEFELYNNIINTITIKYMEGD